MQGNNAGYRIGIAAVFAAALCQAQIGQAQSYTITTVAGGGNSVSGNGDGRPAAGAYLQAPLGVAVDAAGNVYIADRDINNVVRKVMPGGIISTVAGKYTAGFLGDGAAATSAQLNGPSGVAVDGKGNLYVADEYNNRIRKVAAGIITTIAGDGGGGADSGDGGIATAATLNDPRSVALDPSGNLYIAVNRSVRRVAVDGTIKTVVSCVLCPSVIDGGPAVNTFTLPFGMAFERERKPVHCRCRQ